MPRVYNAKEKRERLIMRQKNKCYWCSGEMTNKSGHPTEATLEHLLRRAIGGSGHTANLAAACRECNEQRGRENFTCKQTKDI